MAIRFLFPFLLLIFSTWSAYGLDYFHTYSVFHSPSDGHFFESYLKIPGSSLRVVSAGQGKFQSTVTVALTFKKDAEIVQFDKYNLSSQLLDDRNAVFQMVDQKRYALEPGFYFVELTLTDANDPENKAYNKVECKIEVFDKDKIQISAITVLEELTASSLENDFSKNGYQMVPYVYPYYPNDFKRLIFYTEVYNTDQLLLDQDYLVTYAVCEPGTENVVKNLRGFSKQTGAELNILTAEMDLTELESGNYDLRIEVRNKLNDLLAENKLRILRNNKRQIESLSNIHLVNIEESFTTDMSMEDVSYYLESLVPLAGPDEFQYIENVAAMGDEDVMRRFLHNFFVTRNEFFPEKLFLEHKKAVAIAEDRYSNAIMHGFETDRGRIYIQHGEPDYINRSVNEVNAYPYEVWFYYALEGSQNNIQFVFVANEVAANDFLLIHSNFVGEVQNRDWQAQVQRRTGTNANFGTRISDF